MTDHRTTQPLVSGVKKAALHFSKAAFEVFSGVTDLVSGVAGTIRPSSDDDNNRPDGPEKIEIE